MEQFGITAICTCIAAQSATRALSLDLDHFKRINDTQGHEAGDAALSLFGEILRAHRRAGDLIARMGGEEFCVLLPMADMAAGKGFDSRLRLVLQERSAKQLNFVLTYSAGLACRTADDATLEDLLRRADDALYRAKREGRDRLRGVGCRSRSGFNQNGRNRPHC